MSTLYIGLTILLVFVSLMIITLVLLQKGKGAEAGAAFGAGASGTVFGAKGSTNFLSRATAVLAAVFFANCLALAYLGAQREVPKSLLEDVAETSETEPGAIPVDALEAGELPVVDDALERESVDEEIPEIPDDLPPTDNN